mmetsp:Transcript_10834/g.16166  ORF Transcript_10834/g.16166 Transcript_10834/m.16166 type:complete len:263 (-) Transcript_10834:357-1145(-)
MAKINETSSNPIIGACLPAMYSISTSAMEVTVRHMTSQSSSSSLWMPVANEIFKLSSLLIKAFIATSLLAGLGNSATTTKDSIVSHKTGAKRRPSLMFSLPSSQGKPGNFSSVKMISSKRRLLFMYRVLKVVPNSIQLRKHSKQATNNSLHSVGLFLNLNAISITSSMAFKTWHADSFMPCSNSNLNALEISAASASSVKDFNIFNISTSLPVKIEFFLFSLKSFGICWGKSEKALLTKSEDPFGVRTDMAASSKQTFVIVM